MKAAVANPFERYKGVQKPDEKRRIAVPTSPKLERLLKKFEESIYFWRVGGKYHLDSPDNLTPEEINQFLQLTAKFESHPDYKDNTGSLIARLIQDTYEETEHSKFYLDVRALSRRLNNIGDTLRCTKSKPLELTIEGDAGQGVGIRSGDIIVVCKGNAKGCGHFSTGSKFTMLGNVEICGHGSTSSTFDVHGKLKECGEATNSEYYIRGGLEGNSPLMLRDQEFYDEEFTGLGYRRCLFVAYSEADFAILESQFRGIPEGYDNKLELRDPKTEKIIKSVTK